MNLAGKKIMLRSLAMTDVDFVLACENDTTLWHLSGRKNKMTIDEWRNFMKNSGDFFLDGQLRLVVCSLAGERIGLIDLFDYDRNAKSAAVGVLIADPANRNMGFASEALRLVVEHAFNVFRIRNLRALVHNNNEASKRLFARCMFTAVASTSFEKMAATIYTLTNTGG